jgi:hypothetical protein
MSRNCFIAKEKSRTLLFASHCESGRHKALHTFEINGENGSLFWDLHDLHRLQVFDYKDEGKIRGWNQFTSPTAIIPI